jgi:hypothetical protein
MNKLSHSSMENISGGICAINPGTGECMPNVCSGLAIAAEASGNSHLPLIVCIL